MTRRTVRCAASRLTIGLAAVLVLAACGTSEPESGLDASPTQSGQSGSSAPAGTTSAKPTPTPGDTTTTIDVKVTGNDISPNAEKVKVKRGEQVTLEIVSDREGEFHVHSTPEQQISFGPGRTGATLTFDRPGLVDVEEHESQKLLVQFEVR